MSNKRNTASLAENQKGEKVIKITCSYDLDTIDQIRSLPGRKYYKEDQTWTAPINVESIKHLIEWGFTIDNAPLGDKKSRL